MQLYTQIVWAAAELYVMSESKGRQKIHTSNKFCNFLHILFEAAVAKSAPYSTNMPEFATDTKKSDILFRWRSSLHFMAFLKSFLHSANIVNFQQISYIFPAF